MRGTQYYRLAGENHGDRQLARRARGRGYEESNGAELASSVRLIQRRDLAQNRPTELQARRDDFEILDAANWVGPELGLCPTG